MNTCFINEIHISNSGSKLNLLLTERWDLEHIHQSSCLPFCLSLWPQNLVLLSVATTACFILYISVCMSGNKIASLSNLLSCAYIKCFHLGVLHRVYVTPEGEREMKFQMQEVGWPPPVYMHVGQVKQCHKYRDDMFHSNVKQRLGSTYKPCSFPKTSNILHYITWRLYSIYQECVLYRCMSGNMVS